MMKKKVMPLSCLMAAAMLAGCGTAAPAVPEETTAPAVETAEAAQETAPADAAESEAAAVEKTAGVWQVEPCYNFDEIVPLYSEWDHTAGKNAADGLYAVRDGERWSLFSTKTGNIMMQDAAQQMPYLYGTNELSVWLDDEYYNYDNFAAMREKCEGLNAELQANGAEIEVLYDGVGGYANRWIYTEDGQIYYDLLGTYEFSGTPLVQVSRLEGNRFVDIWNQLLAHIKTQFHNAVIPFYSRFFRGANLYADGDTCLNKSILQPFFRIKGYSRHSA